MANKQNVEENISLRAGFFNKDAFRRKEKLLLVLTTGVAGVEYCIDKDCEEGKRFLDSLTPGTELLLVRDSENTFDKWAIAVYTISKQQLGFIPRYKNETIARLMDYGKRLVAYVDEPQKEILEVELEMGSRTDTEDEDLLIVVYLVE